MKFLKLIDFSNEKLVRDENDPPFVERPVSTPEDGDASPLAYVVLLFGIILIGALVYHKYF